ncbi:hypothetical protein [Dechloromonas sp.]|uniref:hypothetical protein n=1 Tax=Dechloromonas sp. TaxID=1917218 RepID=UPI00263F85D5|nr:hypothetical protein [Dechloromonas sp.]
MDLNLLLLSVLLAGAAEPSKAADVGVSVALGEPGFYGRIDVGDYPRPQLLYAQPRLIRRGPSGRPPVYMHVPPGHARNWRRHCAAYDACDERVYFVRDWWYNEQYVPRYQERHRRGDGPDRRRDDPRGNDRRGNDRGERR